MRFRVAFCVGLIGGLLAVTNAFGQTTARNDKVLRRPDAPLLRGPIAEPALPTPKPMAFKLGRFAGSPSCGVSCAEFIYASGEIRPDSVEALMILQSRLKRPVPVYFNSPGGNLDGGLALGRIMRQFGAEARVGALAALDCRGSSHPCTDADERGGVAVFAHEIAPATCNSSCVYAFAGGRERSLGPGSSLGVHQFFLARADDPQRRPLAHYSRADLAKLDSTHGVINAYLVSMGIRTEVLQMASRIEPQDIRYLTPAELLALNLTTPTFTELARIEIPQIDPAPTGTLRAMLPHPDTDDSHWPMVTRAGRPFIIASIAAESRRFGAITTELAIGCPLDGERYGLTFREIIRARGDERKSARIVVDPDGAVGTVVRAAADTSAPSLRRTAALRADNSGVLVVEVTSAATAGYPTRLEFPARGLQNRIERLEKRCLKV